MPGLPLPERGEGAARTLPLRAGEPVGLGVVIGEAASLQVLVCTNDIAFACEHVAALDGGPPART